MFLTVALCEMRSVNPFSKMVVTSVLGADVPVLQVWSYVHVTVNRRDFTPSDSCILGDIHVSVGGMRVALV